MTGHPPPCRRHPCPPPEPPVAILLSMLVIVIVLCGCPITFLQVSCAAAMLHLVRAAVPYPHWSMCRIIALPGPAVPPLPALDHISVFPEGHMASAFAPKFLGRHRLPSLYKASLSSTHVYVTVTLKSICYICCLSSLCVLWFRPYTRTLHDFPCSKAGLAVTGPHFPPKGHWIEYPLRVSSMPVMPLHSGCLLKL